MSELYKTELVTETVTNNIAVEPITEYGGRRMNKKFQTGDVVVDTYGRHGIVIKYNKYRDDTLALLIKAGDYCDTLESLEHNWTWVGYYGEFKQILKILGE